MILKNLNTLIILTVMVMMIPVLLISTQKRQDARTKAAGSAEISVYLTPSSFQLQPQTSQSISIDLKNSSNSDKSINVAGADLSYDPEFFTISNLKCGSPLPSAAKNEIATNVIYLTCFTPGGNQAFTLGKHETINLGTFDLMPVINASDNIPSQINFLRTNIPDIVTGTDLSDGGTGGEYMILYNINCSRKLEGDANCNNLIDLVDFEFWRREYTGTTGTLRANFNPDIDNVVDLLDFEIWRRTYTSIF